MTLNNCLTIASLQFANFLEAMHHLVNYQKSDIQDITSGLSSAEADSKVRGQCCTITLLLLHMNRLNKTESVIFVSLMCSLLPTDLHSSSSFSRTDYLGVVLEKENCVANQGT